MSDSTTASQAHEPGAPLLDRRAALACLVALAACGGVGEDGTGGPQPAFSVGVLQGLGDGTLTVNGVAYDKTSAAVTDGFGQALSADALRLGMWVEVTGTYDDGTGIGVAAAIRVRPAARGVVTAVGNNSGPSAGEQGAPGSLSITLLESTATYDGAATVIEGVDSAEQLQAGDLVEVHGPLGSSPGTVAATRLERFAAAVPERGFELRGRISNLDTAARTMTVGRQPVDYAGATLTLRQAPANGQVVRVASAQPPVSGQPWPVERLASDQVQPPNLGFFYAEGVTSDWQSGPRFAIESLPVDATAATGRAQITGNDQRVAVLGSLRDGVLVAKAVTVVTPGQPTVFKLSGLVGKYVSTADFLVRAVSIDASAASYVNGSAGDIADGRRVAVTGTVLGRRIVASKVEFLA